MTDGRRILLGAGTPEQAPDVVPLLLQTAEKQILHVWNHRRDAYQQAMEACWRSGETEYAHGRAVVAVEDGQLLGVLLASDAPTHHMLGNATARVVAPLLDAALVAHMRSVVGPVRYLNPHLPDDAYYVNYISVSEAAQGRGIGRLLMQTALERARDSGCRSVHLDTDADSEAPGFYRSLGFGILVETRVPALAREAGIGSKYRMVLDLEAYAAGEWGSHG